MSSTPARSLVLSALLAFAAPAASSAQVCTGDCDGSQQVMLGEVQQAFNIFLGTAAPNVCSAADEDSNGEVTLGEVQVAFNRFLTSCEGPNPDLDEVRASSTTALSSIYGVVSFGQLASGLGGGGGGGGGARLRPGLGLSGGGAGLGSGCGSCFSGFADCTCDVDEFGFSVFEGNFSECVFTDSFGNTVTKSGNEFIEVDDPSFCSGSVAFDVSYSLELTGFLTTIEDSFGNFQVFQAEYIEDFEAFGPGCFPGAPDPLFYDTRGTGIRDLDGEVRTVQGNADGPTMDVTSTTDALSIDVTLTEDSFDCRVDAFVDGTVTVTDAVAGTSFSQAFDGLGVIEVPDSDGTYLVDLEGSVSTDCLGGIDLFTTEPLRLATLETCPTGGRLEVTLQSDGTAAAIEFDSGGGVAFDVGADGSVEEQLDSCVGVGLDQCGFEEPQGVCATCSGDGDCDGDLICAPCTFCDQGFDMRCAPTDDFVFCDGDVY